MCKLMMACLLCREEELGCGVPDLEGGADKGHKAPSAADTMSIWWQTFTMTFLAEWGDRSQIATIALASAKDPYGVTVGGVLGHSMCTGLAVVGGRCVRYAISIPASATNSIPCVISQVPSNTDLGEDSDGRWRRAFPAICSTLVLLGHRVVEIMGCTHGPMWAIRRPKAKQTQNKNGRLTQGKMG
jgi:hypothetical protein